MLLPVSTAATAAADIITGLDHGNAIRVSNRAMSGRTACVSIKNAYVDNRADGRKSLQECRKIGVRNTYTWFYSYYASHPVISISVESGSRVYSYSFKADSVARDVCFRFSASGSFHPADDCKI